MSRYTRQKEKYVKTSEFSRDTYNEGTAARTRPFSFDEIMLRREKKRQPGNVKEGSGGEGGLLGVDTSVKVYNSVPMDEGSKHNDSVPGGIKRVSEDFVKLSSRKKEFNTSLKEEQLVKRKDKGSHDSETKLKASLRKGISDEDKGGKTERRFRGRRKHDEWSGDDSEKESEIRHSMDLVGNDRYADRSKRRSEKESRRKHRHVDDERSREMNAAKKHDSGRRNDSEFLESKEWKESPQFHHEETRLKRRRSRSRERNKDRGRRSNSLSPRVHKRTSNNLREHGDLSSHSSKDKSGRQHSDIDRNRISISGSSSHYRRHSGFASGLGGYSPRKRRTEAAIKTPSPTTRSPEKKNAGWDLPPAGTESNFSGSILSNTQSSNRIVSSNAHELSSVVPALPTMGKPPLGVFQNASWSKIMASIDSVQLTQATRPMRRLYIENLPASASEKSVIDCLNSFLLSSGVNHIQGTQPCISCTMHKEKGQALVEFITPEDASAALSFDGRSFSGSILKIRRPKDFIEVTTGVPEKTVAAVDSVTDIVKDSPHKIFVGGISRIISSKMLMEIASAFGPLKAYHFEANADLNEPCAFLEYVDQSVTIKACAGLNGMSLGGQVLTVVQAIPDSLSVENSGKSPFYGIPEHAKPLLEKPTQVLKLKNVLDPEGLSSLSEPELEEILEDIRLECTRFGTVKSVNVVKGSNCRADPETYTAIDNTGSAILVQELECDDKDTERESLGEAVDGQTGTISRSEPSSTGKESDEVEAAEDKLAKCLIKDELWESSPVDGSVAIEEPVFQKGSAVIPQEHMLLDQLECHDDNVARIIQKGESGMEKKSMAKEEQKSEDVNGRLEVGLVDLDSSVRMESDALEKDEIKEQVSPDGDVLEHGCVLVEFRRAEASCMAAHGLHGRLFDDRIVRVGYVDYDIYRARFPK